MRQAVPPIPTCPGHRHLRSGPSAAFPRVNGGPDRARRKDGDPDAARRRQCDFRPASGLERRTLQWNRSCRSLLLIAHRALKPGPTFGSDALGLASRELPECAFDAFVREIGIGLDLLLNLGRTEVQPRRPHLDHCLEGIGQDSIARHAAAMPVTSPSSRTPERPGRSGCRPGR